jgi:MFS family permease
MILPASPIAVPRELEEISQGTVAQKDSWRGWTVVGASFVGMLLSVGVLVVYSFGVLTSAMAADFGWSNIQRSGLFVSFSLCATLAGPVWGAIADRVGGRRVAIVSSVLLAAGFGVLATIPNSLLGAHLAFAAVGLLGSGTLPAAYASLVVGWFDRHRGLALGLAMVGVGVGTAVMPPLAAEIISRHGWRSMCVAYSLMILVISIPFAVLFLRAHPTHHVQGASARRAIRGTLAAALTQYRTWILAVFAFSTGAVLIANVTNFVPLLQSRGESLTHAALFQSVLGVSLILGRLIGGALLDRVFAPRVVTVILFCTAIGFLVLREANSSVGYIAAACGVGLAIGLEIDFLAYIVSRYYDRAAFTTIFALLFAIYSLGAAAGPPVFAWLVQVSTGYGPALLVSSLGMFVIGLLMFTLPRYEAREPPAAEGT